jgi:glycosyltransferase involved in cell wall biosynthesis
MARVTVVTAAYNSARYISETIESVLAQTYSDYDYVVIDDGSTDGTANIIARYAPRVTVIHQQNAGAGAARNRGVEIAEGEYVAIIDADDVWAPEKLERQVAAMDQWDPDAGLCYTNATSVRVDGTTLETAMITPHEQLTCLMAVTGYHPIVTSSVLFRRRYLESRPYRTNLPATEDYHVNLKVLWRSGERSIFIDEPLVRYRVVETSVLRQIDPLEKGRLTLKAIETFIDDMRMEKPLPRDLQHRGIAWAHFQWAWFCIDRRVSYGPATRQLLRALLGDWRLSGRVARQFVKMGLNRTGLR